MERFTLTEQHILLLSQASIDWFDAETGAPTINPKRPYGNSDVPKSMAKILGIAWDEYEMSPKQIDEIRSAMFKLHRETKVALQIVLCCKTFEPGVYQKPEPYNFGSWKRAAL